MKHSRNVRVTGLILFSLVLIGLAFAFAYKSLHREFPLGGVVNLGADADPVAIAGTSFDVSRNMRREDQIVVAPANESAVGPDSIVSSSTEDSGGSADDSQANQAELEKMEQSAATSDVYGSEVVAFENREAMEFLLSTGFVFQDLLDPDAIVSVPNE